MNQFFFLVIAAFSGIFARTAIPVRKRGSVVVDRRGSTLPYVVGLGISFFAHSGVISYASFAQTPFPNWLPVHAVVPIIDTAPLYAHTSPQSSIALEVVSIAETALLIGLFFSMRRHPLRQAERFVAVSVFATMALYSLFAPAVASTDLYAYVSDARLGVACYSTVAGPFNVPGYLGGHPPIPCAYGPVWIWFVHVLVGRLPDVQSSIIALRFISLISLVAVVAALQRLAVGTFFIALLALDPTVLLQYVADGHNDLFGLALLLWARYFAKVGNTFAGLLLAILAGGSKVPYLPIAMLTFIDRAETRARFYYGAAALCGGALVSLAFGGPTYLKALAITAQVFPTSAAPGGALLPRVAMSATLLTIGVVLYRKRTAWPASWGFATLGSVLFPWYLAWGIPYAALDADVAWPFLVSIPTLVLCLSTTFSGTAYLYPLIALLPFAGIFFFYSSILGFVNVRR